VAEGNLVATRYTFRRTHRIEGGTINVIAAEGMQLFRIGDGVIQEIHSYFDRLNLLVEMGIISPPLSLDPASAHDVGSRRYQTWLAALRRVGYARLSSSTGMVRTPAVWRAYSAKPG
jgi:hypothetical protein